MTRRFLDCSSGHLSPATWTCLDEHLADDTLRESAAMVATVIAGGRTRHGWFVYAADDPPEAMPADLQTVCACARRAGAAYVLLDCDALPNQDLPILHLDFLDTN